ncbi:MAG: sigma-70 family RNA polymerase sigma factor [Planctomycetota bacterium]|jgi:RNA polymerase sigma-70 factor (ECF subfamily)
MGRDTIARAKQVLTDDLELVQRAQKRDAEAFQTLVLRYQDRVYNTAYRLTGERTQAEDLAQDVFFKAFKALRKFKGKSSFSTWLYRITVNACTSEWRRASAQKRGKEVPYPAAGEDPSSPRWEPSASQTTPGEQAERNERNLLVQTAIENLEEDYRVVLVLRDIEGFSYEEIAEIIERPVGTVRSRLHRARNELKEKLKSLL